MAEPVVRSGIGSQQQWDLQSFIQTLKCEENGSPQCIVGESEAAKAYNFVLDSSNTLILSNDSW